MGDTTSAIRSCAECKQSVAIPLHKAICIGCDTKERQGDGKKYSLACQCPECKKNPLLCKDCGNRGPGQCDCYWKESDDETQPETESESETEVITETKTETKTDETETEGKKKKRRLSETKTEGKHTKRRLETTGLKEPTEPSATSRDWGKDLINLIVINAMLRAIKNGKEQTEKEK